MSIITAIFQAIAQAITYILPVSESGHSAIFHDFASRYSGTCSELTGLVHIGIAIGILVAFYKVFIRLIYEFFAFFNDLFHKNIKIKGISSSRKFMILSFIPYIIMLFYLIPLGDRGNVFHVLYATSFDGNLLSEGICFVITAAMLFFASLKLAKKERGVPMSFPVAVLLGAVTFLAVPLAGLSLSALIISVAVLCGINKKAALRYFISISVPILVVMGIVEIAVCVTYVSIIAGIIAVVLSALISFFASKVLSWIISKFDFKYFSYYDFALGSISIIAGVIELIMN